MFNLAAWFVCTVQGHSLMLFFFLTGIAIGRLLLANKDRKLEKQADLGYQNSTIPNFSDY
jgi:uncharacterized membrane protein